MYDDSLYAERAIQAGASGYINKKQVREDIVNAIRTVLAGNIYLSAEYSTRVINRLQTGKPIGSMPPNELLSDRELEAFTLIGHGLKTAEVAQRMKLTTRTIETYRSRIKGKLELGHAGELSRVAARLERQSRQQSRTKTATAFYSKAIGMPVTQSQKPR